jgi:putative flavoprotein involved in K+ transport
MGAIDQQAGQHNAMLQPGMFSDVLMKNNSGIAVAMPRERQYPCRQCLQRIEPAGMAVQNVHKGWGICAAAGPPAGRHLGQRMVDRMSERQITAEANEWISAFAEAVAAKDRRALERLFLDPSYLRDAGALTWDLRQFHGREAVLDTLMTISDEIRPGNFRVSETWPGPSVIGEGDSAYVEAFFDFSTTNGSGVLLLNAERGAEGAGTALKARAVFTRLETLRTIPSTEQHPRGRGYEPSFPGETWKQHRDAARRYEDREPDVIVVGAGQAGLIASAYLRRFGVDVLNIDRYERVGDSWGKRYDSLYLHNPIEMNSFPFLPFPPHYPQYLPKDLLSEWLDMYARYMDLNVWTSTEFRSAKYNVQEGRWEAVVHSADGEERELRPRHIIFATGGIGGKPYEPALPGLENFAGPVMHSSKYKKHTAYDARKVIIVGVATSAHDIARDLVQGGIEVTMLQRGPLVVNNVDTANLAYAGYLDPNTPTELVDLRYGGISMINPLREKNSQAYHKMAKEVDGALLDSLKAAGLELGDGIREQGWLDLFFRTGGGYYLNTGTSELIANRKIRIERFDKVVKFTENGAKLSDGTTLEADMIVLATGYQSRKGEVADAFGEEVAENVGEIARLDSEGEWASMWCQSGQPGLWFTGGGINQARPWSKLLALLVKADLDGLIPNSFRRPPDCSGEKALAKPEEVAA